MPAEALDLAVGLGIKKVKQQALLLLIDKLTFAFVIM
jgi:hypothetical protein